MVALLPLMLPHNDITRQRTLGVALVVRQRPSLRRISTILRRVLHAHYTRIQVQHHAALVTCCIYCA